MSRGSVPLPLLLFLLLTATTTTKGLKAGHDNFIPCSGGTTSGSIIDEILCDPDGLVPPVESHNICQLLMKCGEKAGHVRVVMFLAATFTAPDANIVRSSNSYSASAFASAFPSASASVASTAENVTTEDDGDVDDRTSINLLKELVVASYKLNGSSSTSTTSKTNNDDNTSTSSTAFSPSSILLVVAIKDPFQVATWHSAALDGTLTRGAVEDVERRAGTPLDQQYFSSAVVHVAQELCQKSTRPRGSRALRDIALTVVWIAFVAAFFALLLTIVVALLRAHHRAGRSRRVEAGHEQVRRKESSRPFAITSTSEIQDLGAVYYKSSGKVLLATMDITAVPPHNCSSTDNLLHN